MSYATEQYRCDSVPSKGEIRSIAEEWALGGDWGDNGASVDVLWSLTDDGTGDEIDDGWVTVEIAPDRASLIAAAAGDAEICGPDHDDHDWTSDGHGGCDGKPWCWSLGGTAILISSHCRHCGLYCDERYTGSQRNPDEHDTIEYRMMDADEIAWHRANRTMD